MEKTASSILSLREGINLRSSCSQVGVKFWRNISPISMDIINIQYLQLSQSTNLH